METSPPVRILFVEDAPADMELAERVLRKEDLVFVAMRVDTQDAFLAALASFAPDVIISDYAMPTFDGMRALQLVRERDATCPFILLTGSLNEEIAVNCMKAGATDYVLKERLARLPFAVQEALAQHDTRRAKEHAEQALRESEEKHRLIAELTTDYIYVGDLYPDGTTKTNWIVGAFQRITGYTAEEINALANGFASLVAPADLAEVVRQRQAAPTPAVTVEYRITTKFGEERWLRDYMRATPAESQPGVVRLIGAVQDITERKRAELERMRMLAELQTHQIELQMQNEELLRAQNELAASRERYFDLYNLAPTGYVTLNDKGMIMEANLTAANLLGVTRIELVNQPLTRFVLNPDQEIYFLHRRRLVETRAPQTCELRMLRQDGAQRWVRIEAKLAQNSDGAPVFWETLSDITERKRAEQASARYNELLAAVVEVQHLLAMSLSQERLYQNIAQGIHQLYPDIATVFVSSFDAEREIIKAVYGWQDGESLAVADLPEFPLAPPGHGTQSQVIRSRQPLIIAADLRQNLHNTQVVPVGTTSGETQSAVYVPMLVQDRVLGLIQLQSYAANRFTPEDARALTLIANAAGVSLQNARLYEQAQIEIAERQRAQARIHQHVHELEVVNRVSTALRAAQTLDEMLPLLMDRVLEAVGAEAGAISLYDAGLGLLRRVVARGWLLPAQHPALLTRDSIVGTVFDSGNRFVTREFITDPHVPPSLQQSAPAGWGGVCLPIRTAEAVIGVLCVSTCLPRELNDWDVNVLDSICEIAGNALHRMRLHEQTHQRLERLNGLRMIDSAITASLDLRITLDVILDQVIAQLGVGAADVLLVNPREHMLTYAAGRGFAGSAITRSRVRLGEGLAGRVGVEHRLIHIADLAHAEFARAQLLADEKFVAYYAVPLIAKGQLCGVLEAFERAATPRDTEWFNFFKTLGNQAALAVDSLETFDRLQRSNLELSLAYDTTLEVWSRALDLHNREPEGHTLQMADLTVQLARRLGTSEKDLIDVRRGALLHDIGNFIIPDAILLKQDTLDQDEINVMRQHPVYAQDLLSSISFLRNAAVIPYNHHERWDGSGYPRGLRGEDIPFPARIFALVDVWDALISVRSYRPAWSRERAMVYLRDHAGVHFDPRVVEAFLQIVE